MMHLETKLLIKNENGKKIRTHRPIKHSKNYFQRKNNKKIAKTRRQRGYNWEDALVKRFNFLNDWNAFRLGSPSNNLPDVFAISNKNSTIFTIEAKSGTNTSLSVPFDQIERCLKWVKTFELYKTRKVVLAFKFLSKKRVGLGKYEKRELREFYKIWDESYEIIDLVCRYDGRTYGIKNGERMNVELKDIKMPFKIRKRGRPKKENN